MFIQDDLEAMVDNFNERQKGNIWVPLLWISQKLVGTIIAFGFNQQINFPYQWWSTAKRG